MREIRGDLWGDHGTARIAITTGGLVSPRGECVMTRGCARQARERYPGLAAELGALIREGGNHVFALGAGLVSFPVEESPWEVPGLRLVERSCRELVALTDDRGWEKVVVPRPGCGSGGLSWAEVRPILQRHFDDRFCVITQEQEESQVERNTT